MQLTQQGFTADVDCRQNDPNDLGKYNPQAYFQSITTGGTTGTGISAVELVLNCSTGTISEGLLVVFVTLVLG
jgi:hypothetical protein